MIEIEMVIAVERIGETRNHLEITKTKFNDAFNNTNGVMLIA